MAAEPAMAMASAPTAAGRRRGFALLAVLILVAIIAVLATAVTATMGAGRDAGRIEAVAEGLRRLSYGIGGEVGPNFRNNVGLYPLRLSHLVTKILSTDLNSCGSTYGSAPAGLWRGPYHLTPMGANVATQGYTLASGFVANDLLVRDPASGTASELANLYIVMSNVSRPDAEALGLVMDGTRAGAGPRTTVRFGTGNPVTVTYILEIIGC